MRLQRGRFTLWLNGLDLREVSVPRPVFFFEGCVLEVGGRWASAQSDPVLGVTLGVDLPGAAADALYGLGQRLGVWT